MRADVQAVLRADPTRELTYDEFRRLLGSDQTRPDPMVVTNTHATCPHCHAVVTEAVSYNREPYLPVACDFCQRHAWTVIPDGMVPVRSSETI